MGGTSDPYVKAIITPGNKKYYLETKPKMRELNPEWKETFYFEGSIYSVYLVSVFHLLVLKFICVTPACLFCYINIMFLFQRKSILHRSCFPNWIKNNFQVSSLLP